MTIETENIYLSIV